MRTLIVTAACVLSFTALTAAPVPIPGERDETFGIFGKKIDPRNDCKFKLDDKTLSIRVGKGDHFFCLAAKRMDAPRTLSDITGDFELEVKVSAKYPKDAKPARDKEFQTQFEMGLLIQFDDDRYFSLVKGLADERTGWVNCEFDHRKNRQGGSVSDASDLSDTTRLRLVRTGNKILSTFSKDDGKSWNLLPNPLENQTIPKSVKIGVLAAHNTDSEFEAKFEEYTVKPIK